MISTVSQNKKYPLICTTRITRTNLVSFLMNEQGYKESGSWT